MVLVSRKIKHPSGTYWQVSLGRRYTGSKRQRRYFAHRKEAKDFILQAEEARRRIGNEAFILPLGIRAEALVCSQRLGASKATLTQATDYYLAHHTLTYNSLTVVQLRDEFLRSRRNMNCRATTLSQYQSNLRVICERFGSTDIALLARDDIEDWLEDSTWSPRTRRNYLVTLTTLINFAIHKGLRLDNPAATVERPLLDDKPVGILSVPQTSELLRVAEQEDPELVPAITLGLFAGLRRSEFFALEWREINLEQGTIEVKASKAKTRQRRIIHLRPNVITWLKMYSGNKQERLLPMQNIDTFSERLREVANKAKILPWPHNAMRHSFGSYFLADTKNENLTASEMGNSPAVVIKHYRAVVHDAEANAYWALIPSR